MVLQCEKCQAKFQIADDKIAATGTSVRCSKCKHVFKAFRAEVPAVTQPSNFEFVADQESTEDLFGSEGSHAEDAVEQIENENTNVNAVAEMFAADSEDDSMAMQSVAPEPDMSVREPAVALPKPIALKKVQITTKPPSIPVEQKSRTVVKPSHASKFFLRCFCVSLFIVTTATTWWKGYSGIRVSQSHAAILDSEAIGRIAVVEGELRNNSWKTQNTPALILSLMDSQGQIVTTIREQCCTQANWEKLLGITNFQQWQSFVTESRDHNPFTLGQRRSFMLAIPFDDKFDGYQLQINPS